jgi:hypothetical protein
VCQTYRADLVFVGLRGKCSRGCAARVVSVPLPDCSLLGARGPDAFWGQLTDVWEGDVGVTSVCRILRDSLGNVSVYVNMNI